MGDEHEGENRMQFHARSIVAEVQNGALRLGITDFSRTPIIAARPRTSVKFEAGISREEAMAALEALLQEIEANGIPETSFSINRDHAKMFERMLKNFAAARRDYDHLSPKHRQHWDERRALEKGKDTVPKLFSEERMCIYIWTVTSRE
jgi:hypothetical protein